jgi:hypothetical protein
MTEPGLPPPPPGIESAIDAVDFEAYEDAACTRPLTSIHWGQVPPGGTSSPVIFYLKNISDGVFGIPGSAAMLLNVDAYGYNPQEAFLYMVLHRINSGAIWKQDEVKRVTLTLSIQPWVFDPTFTFTLWLKPEAALKLDVAGHDYKIDVKDVSTVAKRFGRFYGDGLEPHWHSIFQCDVNYDNKIDIKDITLVARSFGEHLI